MKNARLKFCEKLWKQLQDDSSPWSRAGEGFSRTLDGSKLSLYTLEPLERRDGRYCLKGTEYYLKITTEEGSFTLSGSGPKNGLRWWQALSFRSHPIVKMFRFLTAREKSREDKEINKQCSRLTC